MEKKENIKVRGCKSKNRKEAQGHEEGKEEGSDTNGNINEKPCIKGGKGRQVSHIGCC